MDGPIFPVMLPQWTHADLPTGEQAALWAAKQMLAYNRNMPPQPPKILMHTGEIFEVFDNEDGRWGAALIRASGPPGLPVVWGNGQRGVTPKIGDRFVARHGAEHESLPEISTQNIRVECGVVRLEGRVGAHDQDIAELRRAVADLQAENAALRERLRWTAIGPSDSKAHSINEITVERNRLSPEDLR